MNTPTISLITNVVIFALLIFGYSLSKRKSLTLHGYVFLAAVIIHISTFLTLMLPLFLVSPSSYIPNLSTFMGIGNLIHIVSGAITDVLAIYIVYRWIRNHLDPHGCMGKNIMRATMILWLISFLTGLFAYYIF